MAGLDDQLVLFCYVIFDVLPICQRREDPGTRTWEWPHIHHSYWSGTAEAFNCADVENERLCQIGRVAAVHGAQWEVHHRLYAQDGIVERMAHGVGEVHFLLNC